MECLFHHSDQLIERYIRNNVTREEEIQVEDLFSTCEQCASRYDQLRASRGPIAVESPGSASNGLRKGDIFTGRYLLVSLLGSGGFAPVWQAQDLASKKIRGAHRTVALKVIPDSVKARDFPVAGDFAKLHSLNHPHVMKVEDHGFDQTTQCHYLVCQFIDGKSLSEIGRNGNVEYSKVLHWMEQLAQALEYIHARDLVHFDVKPANVLIVDGLHVVLIDFGVSAHRETLWKNWGAGTRLYESPEHLQYPGGKQNPDGRSDVWSVGVIMFEILTGERPFETIDQIGIIAPTPPNVPDSVNEIWQRCLRKDPSDRYTARQLRKAISKVLRPKRILKTVVRTVLITMALAFASWSFIYWQWILPPTWRTVDQLPATIHNREWLVYHVSSDRPVNVTNTIRINGGGRLRIEGCGRLLFARNTGIHSQGVLVVDGVSKDEPLYFQRLNPQEEWAGVQLVGKFAAESRFNNAKFEGGGGALCNVDDPRPAGIPNQLSITFPESSDVRVAAHGGALLIAQTHNIQLSSVYFTHNCARRGGAVFIFDSQKINFLGCHFVGNETEIELQPRMGTGPPAGGAVFTQLVESVRFSQCRFVANRAPSRHACGGAVYGGFRSFLQFRACEFVQNQSGHVGGALYLASFQPLNRDDYPGPPPECVVKEQCLFQDNLAGFWYPSEGQRRPVKFGRGKAIYIDHGIELRLRHSKFIQSLLNEPVVVVDGVQTNPSRFTMEDCQFLVGRDGATLADVCLTPNAGKHDGISITPDSNEVKALNPIQEDLQERGFMESASQRNIDTVVVHHVSALNWDRDDPDKDFDGAFRELFVRNYPELASVRGRERDYHPKFIKAIFEAYNSAPHYLISRDGQIYRLTAENNVAFHAGISRMPEMFDPEQRTDVNQFSIGIELIAVHPRDDNRVSPEVGVRLFADGKEPAYTYAQYEALSWLLNDIGRRHTITAVVGHDEITQSPIRPAPKEDPGTHFNWSNVRDDMGRPLP